MIGPRILQYIQEENQVIRVFDMNQQVENKNCDQLHTFPIIFLANIQSFGKTSTTDKTTECEIIFKTNNVDIGIFCET